MDFEFHPEQWLEIARHNPVLVVLFGGQLGGAALTQAAKRTYVAWANGSKISDKRYANSVMWFAILWTFIATNALWEAMIGDHSSGLRHVVSGIAAVAAPFAVYPLVRWAVAKKFPDFADKWMSGNGNGGKNGH